VQEDRQEFPIFEGMRKHLSRFRNYYFFFLLLLVIFSSCSSKDGVHERVDDFGAKVFETYNDGELVKSVSYHQNGEMRYIKTRLSIKQFDTRGILRKECTLRNELKGAYWYQYDNSAKDNATINSIYYDKYNKNIEDFWVIYHYYPSGEMRMVYTKADGRLIGEVLEYFKNGHIKFSTVITPSIELVNLRKCYNDWGESIGCGQKGLFMVIAESDVEIESQTFQSSVVSLSGEWID
jgi:hypothetical protein